MKHREQLGLGRSRTPFFSAAAIFSFLVAFVCFFPNPALPLGGSTGLQAGQIAALLSLPVVLMLGLPRRQVLVLLLLLLPMLLSSFIVVLAGQALSNDVALKTTISTLLVFMVLVPAGWMINERHYVPLLSGAAWAIVLNAVIGLYQIYWFARDKFPLPDLYQNPSFSSFIMKDPQRWATYAKRPFGLFPEPSAMAASMGPWLVLIIALLLYPKLRQGMTRATIMQLLLAVACGIGLILASSSGFTTWLLASLVLVTLPYLKGRVMRLHRPGSLFTLVALILLGLVLVEISAAYVGTRVDIQENSSWSARLASIVWSLGYLGTSPSTFLFGIGPGQAYLILQSPGSSNFLATSTGEPVTAVWSVVMNYVLEAGLLGALAWTLILIMVSRAIVRSSARLVGLSCFIAWLAGVVFTTSYLALLPIWLFLGLLLVWDRIFSVRATVNGPGRKPGTLPVPKALQT